MNIKQLIAVWIFLALFFSGCSKFSLTEKGQGKFTIPFDFPQKNPSTEK
jgi:hypothetical protein